MPSRSFCLGEGIAQAGPRQNISLRDRRHRWAGRRPRWPRRARRGRDVHGQGLRRIRCRRRRLWWRSWLLNDRRRSGRFGRRWRWRHCRHRVGPWSLGGGIRFKLGSRRTLIGFRFRLGLDVGFGFLGGFRLVLWRFGFGWLAFGGLALGIVPRRFGTGLRRRSAIWRRFQAISIRPGGLP